MAEWPANGATDWNTKMLAYLAVEHATDGTHNKAGTTRQIVNTQTGTKSSGNTLVPEDNTIPQNDEGDEYMTLAITPTSATNKLKIDVVVFGANQLNYNIVAALFQDATANALAVGATRNVAADDFLTISFTHYMASGTTSETTFKVRVGPVTASTFTFNGSNNAAKFGGKFASSITITEIQV